MSWVGRNKPPVSAPKRRGFGTIVTHLMAERSLGGRVDLDYAPSGVTWRLPCPAANALGSPSGLGAVALAERICGEADRLDPTGMS
jgi:hypothetical protein